MTDAQIAAANSPVAINLLTENPVYKPFRYPWAYEAWLTPAAGALAAGGSAAGR